MINSVCLAGRLVADPDTRTVGSGTVTNFTIACDRNYKNQAGERDTDFFRCTAWNSTSKFASEYLKKGYLVFLQGSLKATKYEDKDGNTVNKVEVDVVQIQPIFPPRNGESNNSSSDNEGRSTQPDPSTPPPESDNLPWDDDIPF